MTQQLPSNVRVSDATLDMEIGSYAGEKSLHARDVHSLLCELREWRKLATDKAAAHIACLRGIIALTPENALHIGGTSRNELEQLRARASVEPEALRLRRDVIGAAAYQLSQFIIGSHCTDGQKKRLREINQLLIDSSTAESTGQPPPVVPGMRRFFKVNPCVVAGEPKACRIVLHIGVQTIPIGPEYCEDADHAEWWIDMVCRALQNVIAATSTAQPPFPWQPIETAPKDGTPILTVVAGWQPGIYQWHAFEEGGGRWTPDPECFLAEEHLREWLDGTTYEPTHWMPLPTGPTKSAGTCRFCDGSGFFYSEPDFGPCNCVGERK